MLAIADAAVVQAVEAEGVHVGILGQDLRQDVDEEIAVGAEQAEHAAVRILLHVGLRDLRGVGRDPPPVGMVLVDLALKARRIDAQDADAEPLVFGDVLLEPAERHVRAAPLQELAVVIGVERIDEAHLADRHPVGGRRGPRLGVHPRERVAAADGLLHPGRDLDLAERSRVERLFHDDLAPDPRLISPGKVGIDEDQSERGHQCESGAEGGLMVAVPKRRAGLFPGKAPFGLTSAPNRIKELLAGDLAEGSRLRGCQNALATLDLRERTGTRYSTPL